MQASDILSCLSLTLLSPSLPPTQEGGLLPLLTAASLGGGRGGRRSPANTCLTWIYLPPATHATRLGVSCSSTVPPGKGEDYLPLYLPASCHLYSISRSLGREEEVLSSPIYSILLVKEEGRNLQRMSERAGRMENSNSPISGKIKSLSKDSSLSLRKTSPASVCYSSLPGE